MYVIRTKTYIAEDYMKIINSLDARDKWATIQKDALSGEIIAIQRHGVITAVIMPPEWAELYQSEHWIALLDKMRVKSPGHSDLQLITGLLQRWEWQQDSNSSKDAKLSKIYELLLWVARKLGYSE